MKKHYLYSQKIKSNYALLSFVLFNYTHMHLVYFLIEECTNCRNFSLSLSLIERLFRRNRRTRP